MRRTAPLPMSKPLRPPVRYRAVVFDMDDTLISRQDAFRVYVADFYERQTTLHATDREEAIGLITEWDGRGDNDKMVFFGRLKERWPGLDMPVPELIEDFFIRMAVAVEADPEANRFLGDLSAAGVPWGILTNGESQFQRGKMATTGLDAIAPFALVPSEFGDQKPSPAVFEEAVRLAGHDTSVTLFVGDNPRTDIRGAQGIGMPTAWMKSGREWVDGDPMPDHQIDHITELRGLLLG